jgi:hypothetical protein
MGPMKLARLLICGTALTLLTGPAAYAEVQVTMHDGRVSVVAKDATLRQIMMEWARVGETKVINVERIPGGPLTLELRDVPEDKALDVLMRSLSGYLAAPRAVPASNLSRFDRIVVMPTIAAARQATAATAAATPPVFQQAPVPSFQQAPGQQPAEDPDEPPAPPPGGTRGPVFTAFPQPQVTNPNAAGAPGAQPPAYVVPPGINMPGAQQTVPPPPAAPSAVPTAAPGVAVPGMMVPTPAPAQPGQQAPGTTPVRRPGGQ